MLLADADEMRRSSVGGEWPQFEFSPKRRDDVDVVISESPSPFKNSASVIDLTTDKMRLPPAAAARKRKKSPKNDRRKTLALSFERAVVDAPGQIASNLVKSSLAEQADNRRRESVDDDDDKARLVVKVELPITPEKKDSCLDMFDDASLSPVLDDTFRIQAVAKARNLSSQSFIDKTFIQSAPLLFSSSASIIIDPDTDDRQQSLLIVSEQISIQVSQSVERESPAPSSSREPFISSIQEAEESDDSTSRSSSMMRSASAPPADYEPTSSAEADQAISGRLRRSFLRGGLADQLYRAVNGARSERTVWLQGAADERRIPQLELRIEQTIAPAWGLIKVRSTGVNGREWDVLMRHDWIPRTALLTVGIRLSSTMVIRLLSSTDCPSTLPI
uniref:Uncharacterized protein n=1 Tax=Plectus sambesii TaxID=2011161 RepID=A0A914WL92_9BILA